MSILFVFFLLSYTQLLILSFYSSFSSRSLLLCSLILFLTLKFESSLFLLFLLTFFYLISNSHSFIYQLVYCLFLPSHFSILFFPSFRSTILTDIFLSSLPSFSQFLTSFSLVRFPATFYPPSAHSSLLYFFLLSILFILFFYLSILFVVTLSSTKQI